MVVVNPPNNKVMNDEPCSAGWFASLSNIYSRPRYHGRSDDRGSTQNKMTDRTHSRKHDVRSDDFKTLPIVCSTHNALTVTDLRMDRLNDESPRFHASQHYNCANCKPDDPRQSKKFESSRPNCPDGRHTERKTCPVDEIVIANAELDGKGLSSDIQHVEEPDDIPNQYASGAEQ